MVRSSIVDRWPGFTARSPLLSGRYRDIQRAGKFVRQAAGNHHCELIGAGLKTVFWRIRPEEFSINFIQVWLTGYYSPSKLIDLLINKPAPHWGIYAQLLRGVLDSALVYLPVALMGRTPPTPSYIQPIPTETYYFALIWLAPPILILILLVQSVVIHTTLRLLHHRSDIDQIINLVGMSALIVGAVLIPWDWAMFAAGLADQYFLGITHLLISLWAVVLLAVGLRRLFSVSLGLSILLSLLLFPAALPFAMMFMRSPF